MSDYIDRQSAIDAVCKVCSLVGDYQKCDGYPETSKWCEELVALRALPSAEVEPVKHGRWKPFDLTWGRSVYACTSCGAAFEVPTEMEKPIFIYCPNCGAKMEGEEREE